MAEDVDDEIDSDPEELEVLEGDDDEVFVDDEFPDDTEDDTDEVDDTDEEDDESGPVADIDSKAVAEAGPAKGAKAKSSTASDDEEGADDEDDEPDPDDVEADLDTILKDRLVVADDEEDDDEEPPEPEDRGEGAKVRPRAPGEFVCRSCCLVKHPSQLADETNLLCRDCV